jgi:hypothetical protein
MGSVLFLPKGLMGLVRPWIEERLARRSGAPVATPSPTEGIGLASGSAKP